MDEIPDVLRQGGHGAILCVGARSDRQVALAYLIVSLQFVDAITADDFAFVDHRRLAGDAEAEMHVLFGKQDGGAGVAQVAQQLTNALHYDRLSLIHISEPTRLGMISYA